MRILVMSDSHGMYSNMRRVVMKHSDAEVIIFCGDGASDIEEIKREFTDRAVIAVRGNCDFCTDNPNIETITLEGKKLFITHGHLYNVKSGLYNLACACREAGADIAVFGHTHLPTEIYDDGIYLFNPGSIMGYEGSYGLIDITPQGIMTNTVKFTR